MEKRSGIFDKENMVAIHDDYSIDILYPGIRTAKSVLGYIQDYHGNYRFVIELKNGRLKYVNVHDVEMWWSKDMEGRSYDYNKLWEKVINPVFWK